MDKITARKKALSNRRSVDINFKSKLIVANIVNSRIIDSFKTIGIYYPLYDEIDLLELINLYPDKTFCLPKTTKEIEFYELDNIANVKLGKFNIYEPISDEVVIPEIIFVPCLALTFNNARLGYGKGYYDRYSQKHKLIYIGVCNCENVFDFEYTDYDLILDKVFIDLNSAN